MSTDSNCPFCDSLDAKNDERTFNVWEGICTIISNYFSNFTYDHFNKLCESCLTYTQEFCKSRKSWSNNEAKIHKKRLFGQFKGLKDIVNLKKNSFLICRLCFKGSPSEEVIFIYHENKIYQPGYIQNMLHLHANNIDLNMTENPVICQECLDGIQTFDALYQMCLETQAGKVKPDLEVKNVSDSQYTGSPEKDTQIVHVQLKKSSNNSLVLHPITEAESAVNSLMRSRELPESPVVLNGWTTKKLINMVQNPKSTKKNETNNNQEACIVRDEDELVCNPTAIEGKESNNDHLDYTGPGVNSDIVANEKRVTRAIQKNILERPNNNNSDIPSPQSDIIEIHDSDEEEAIVLPRILNVSTVNETEETEELQLQNDLGPGGVEIDEDIDVIPTIEINMAAVSQLFSNNESKCEFETIVADGSDTETDMDGSDVTFVDDSSNSNTSQTLKIQSKNILEENLSDFLQFNKESDVTTKCLKRSSESVNINETCKKARMATFNKSDLETYSSAYECFLLKDSEPKSSAWKLLRGSFDTLKNDEYCSWFPFYTKLFPASRRKCYMTALENQYGSRIYRCNACLLIMKEESVAGDHNCMKLRAKKRIICPIKKCGFYTFNDFLLSQHKKAHTFLSNSAIQEYKCSFCKFFSANKECMRRHIETLHGKGAVETTVSKCKFCFFESTKPDILEHHISVRHSYKKTKFTKKNFS